MSKPNKKGRNPLLRRTRPLLALAVIWIGLPNPAAAQVLPPIPEVETNRLATAPRLFVRSFQFEGNTAFTAMELSQVTASYTNRQISTTELEQARRAVSLHYVTRGYINSGAVIPDQDPTNGLIRIRIVEGRLTGINLHDNKWLSDHYIKSRVGLWSEAPLDMNKLRDGLQSLRQNPNVEQVNAELKPGAVPGESQLDLRVEDRHPFRVGLQADNQRPPTVGAAQFWLLASDLKLTGNSDPLELRYGIANMTPDRLEFSGVDNLEGSYRIPFTRYDTTLGLRGSRLNTLLIEETFEPDTVEELDIESLTSTYGVELRQPFFKTANQELTLSLAFDHARNKTWVLGVPFALSPGADADGEMKVSSLRFSQEWMQRGQNDVLALRSTFNFGLDVLDSTHNGVAGDPDGTYFSWVGQAQYLQRLFKTQNQLILRLTGQCTEDRLLALEQMSIGGFDTVRGYLENQLVRDRGVVASAEVRVPVLFNKAGEGIVFLAPFADLGSGRNVNAVEEDEPSGTLNTIWSLGAGLLVSPNKHFSAQVYWGYRFRDIDEPEDAGAQGAGISFRLNVEAF